MSLVAYGSSDESEEESEEVEHLHNEVSLGVMTGPVSKPNPRSSDASEALGLGSILDEDGERSSNSSKTPRPIQSLFQSLPKPKQNACESNEEDDQLESQPDILPVGLLAFLPEPQSSFDIFRPRSALGSGSSKDFNKKIGTVKITLPSLSQFDDEKEDEPARKKLKPSQKGSGLFAILPAPKNIKVRENQQPLVPYVLTKKPSLINPFQTKNSKRTLARPLSPEAGNASEEEEEKDFFSLNSVHKPSLPKEAICTDPSVIVGPIHRFPPSVKHEIGEDGTSVHSSNEEPLAFHSGFLPSPWANESPSPCPSRAEVINSQDPSNSGEEYWTSQEPNSSFQQQDLQLDAEAMQRLCGRRSKKHQQPVEFIDVSGKEIMPDPKDWLVKQLSEEQPKMRSHSHKRNDGPTTQQRRKHQITYLAFQAKENELELKNQWSQNRMSRKQTQSKYGF